MNALTIANHSIRTSDNLYSLNDLHKSSGGAKKHEPYQFMRNKQTQELIQAIEAEGNIAYHTVQGGNAKQQGTFVCREIVIAYACWISAHFHLVVLRAFDALNTGAIPCLDRPRLSDFQAFTLQKAVRAKCGGNRSHYQALYRTLYNAFGVNSYKNILAEDFDEAMAIVERFNPNPINITEREFCELLVGCAVHLRHFAGVLSNINSYAQIMQYLERYGYRNSYWTKNYLTVASPIHIYDRLAQFANMMNLRTDDGRPIIDDYAVRHHNGVAHRFD